MGWEMKSEIKRKKKKSNNMCNLIDWSSQLQTPTPLLPRTRYRANSGGRAAQKGAHSWDARLGRTRV